MSAPAESSAAPIAAAPKQYFTGIVKQVLDGGSVIIRGQPRNGPPPERVLALSDIDPPRLARRQTPSGNPATSDDPCAWEAREFLRKLLVGKAVLATVNYTVPASGREYGAVLFGSNDPEQAENATVKLVSEGWAKVRETCQDQALKDAQTTAKNAGKGVWADDAGSRVRNITWDVDNPRSLVAEKAGKKMSAVIEHVRDGSTVRAFLLPDMINVTLMMSGVRAPGVRTLEGKPDPSTAEPFALEAHYFTESRLLQRDVEVILESVNNYNFVGSIIHPNGNIAEAILKEGLAKCVDWSLQCVTGGAEKYRAAQASAKERRVKLWKDYTGPTGPQIADKDKSFTGKVVEVVNGDSMVVKRGKGDYRKVFLASIRPPRLPDDATRPAGFRPLYDIPHMFEAREFLRKKLIGQNVHVVVDYIQPANNDFPEKIQSTVTIGGINVAEALVAKGLATVVRYSADNDQRSSHYDDLLAAEDKAMKSSKGVHEKKGTQGRRIVDLTGDSVKSKAFFPFLQRAGRVSAVVEYVASGSRFRVYIPRETCVITLLLAGISCPRGARNIPGQGPQPAEPFGDEALMFSKELCMQREVEIEVDSQDKGGNFIGFLFVDNKNISIELVEDGLAKAHPTADRTNYGRFIAIAEENAKRRREKVWAGYVEPTEDTTEADEEAKAAEEAKDAESERKVNYEKVVVTEVTEEAKVFVQVVDSGPKLEELMKEIRAEFTSNPPLSGAYQPKRGDMCAAKFVDGEWYRAKVEKVAGAEATVLYVDYGNRATISKAKCGTLPANFQTAPPFAKEFSLALCRLAPDEEYAALGLKALKEDVLDRALNMNIEYRVGGVPFISLSDTNKDDIVKNLITDGLMLAEKKGGRKLAKLVDSYVEAQESAKKNHLNMWEYGDITADDAKEFGTGR